jgi:hypothetical protein
METASSAMAKVQPPATPWKKLSLVETGSVEYLHAFLSSTCFVAAILVWYFQNGLQKIHETAFAEIATALITAAATLANVVIAPVSATSLM